MTAAMAGCILGFGEFFLMSPLSKEAALILVLFLLLGAALQVCAVAQTVLALPTAQGVGSDLRQALALAPGERLRLERLPLGDTKAQVVSADLRRTHGSVPLLEVHSDKGVQLTQPAARAHGAFRGRQPAYRAEHV